MDTNPTFEAYLRQMITQIIDEAVETAIARHFPAHMVSQPNQTEIMDIKMAAQFIHLAVPTIYALVHNRAIPNYKRGKRLYFRKDDLVKWIEIGRRKTILEAREEVVNYLQQGRRK